jgi:hypothetical protein
MRRVSGYFLMVVTLGQVGCAANPMILRIAVAQSEPAQVSLRLKSNAAIELSHCQTPCSVDIPRGSGVRGLTPYQLTLRAPGYYPATLELTYEAVLRSAVSEGTRTTATLVVPMERRNESATAASQ